MALVWTILNCLKKTLSMLIRELRALLQLIAIYQKNTNKRKVIAKIIGIKLIEHILLILCSYFGISKGVIPFIKILIEILLGG
ncbi:hypothetical protein Metok_0327 [Methanothermococcus okinawensis IH1]|uniref:Uncharacterized protein n=1 Tax=Methanothermococcus okinawensis (strain DSM 14208 / JCM 11175 / IH1) TaxID=647113 RepID=F8AKB7_METOI|nr:hypothetical protein Metok_0327 [Methanothermococcus okinawensis IH1]